MKGYCILFYSFLEITYRIQVIRCMEILTGLASFEGNEEIICEFLSNRLIERIFDITGIKDIMMCVYALECIYQVGLERL